MIVNYLCEGGKMLGHNESVHRILLRHYKKKVLLKEKVSFIFIYVWTNLAKNAFPWAKICFTDNKIKTNKTGISCSSLFFFPHSEIKESCKREFITFTLGSLIITDAVNVGLKPICPQDELPNPRLENFASHVFIVLFHAQLDTTTTQLKYNFNTKAVIFKR